LEVGDKQKQKQIGGPSKTGLLYSKDKFLKTKTREGYWHK